MLCYSKNMKTVTFQGELLELEVTDHVKERMVEREITEAMLIQTIQHGELKAKPGRVNKFWVWMEFTGREDNCICFSLVVERPKLVLITAMTNWRPK